MVSPEVAKRRRKTGPSTKLSPGQIVDLLNDYAELPQEATISSLLTKYGIAKSTFYGYLSKAQKEKNPPRLQPKEGE